jgi:hypothetical protein
VKQSQCIGEVIDTSKVELIPISEAKIFKYGVEDVTGPIPQITEEKKKYLLDNFNCPVDDPIVKK